MRKNNQLCMECFYSRDMQQFKSIVTKESSILHEEWFGTPWVSMTPFTNRATDLEVIWNTLYEFYRSATDTYQVAGLFVGEGLGKGGLDTSEDR